MTPTPSNPRRALILCGGGARGAMEVGFYQAITELDLTFDLIVASSVGALNGALIAAGLSPAELADQWGRTRRRDMVAWDWRGLLSAQGGILTLRPLRRLLEHVLPVRRFEALRHPLVIATTNLNTGGVHYWHSEGDLIEPLIASMSLPGVFPPVWIEGQQHVDGGVGSNVPFEPALERGIRDMLLILCTCCPPAERTLRSPLAILFRSFSIALNAKYLSDLAHYQRQYVSIRAVNPSFPDDVELLDFTQTRALIRAGYEQTLATFDATTSRDIPSTKLTPNTLKLHS